MIDGLYGVVNDQSGTAYEAYQEVGGSVSIAGKTAALMATAGRAARATAEARRGGRIAGRPPWRRG